MLLTGRGLRNIRGLAAALGLALLLAACGIPIEEEEEAAPEPGQPVVVVRPTPRAPDATLEPATPSLAELPSCYQPVAEPLDLEGTPVEPTERIASPGPVPPPSYYPPLALQEDPALEERLRDLLGDDVESYGIVVKSLEDGRGARINADKVFYAASLFKVTVLFEVFHQRALGLLGFQEELLVTPYYAGFDLGTLPVGVCDTISVEEALRAMTAFSDNTSAVLLQDRVGAGNVNRSMAALGLTTTRLLSDDLPTTAGEMALLMEMMARGEAVSEAASQEMVNLLAGEKIDNGLRAGLPEGTLVAHKTGKWSNATHDVGIVYAEGPTGSPSTEGGSASGGGAAYVIAILSDKEFEDDDAFPLAEISRVVWEYFAVGSPDEQ